LTYKGLTFAGLEGSMRYNKGKIQYTESQMMQMVLKMGLRVGYDRFRNGHGVDVLVTHSPPFGIHDAEDLPHTGFKSLLKFMEWYKPRYMIHGHVHTYDRRKATRTKHGDTCIMNINPYTVLEVESSSEEGV
jgi:Icc-related predicted phosphoesterase